MPILQRILRRPWQLAVFVYAVVIFVAIVIQIVIGGRTGYNLMFDIFVTATVLLSVVGLMWIASRLESNG